VQQPNSNSTAVQQLNSNSSDVQQPGISSGELQLPNSNSTAAVQLPSIGTAMQQYSISTAVQQALLKLDHQGLLHFDSGSTATRVSASTAPTTPPVVTLTALVNNVPLDLPATVLVSDARQHSCASCCFILGARL
jgi:hypothetical protein